MVKVKGLTERTIAERFAEVVDIHMPRARKKLPPSEVIGRFQRREE